jgi:GrpB-like predicted nucleotidyltransferase (UPF0157 family)
MALTCHSDTDVVDDRIFPASVGLAYGTVRVVEHDPLWVAIFDRLASKLRAALADVVLGVEHVGSTAVPDLVAKPIIDIAVGLTPTADAGQITVALASLGYQYRGDKGEHGGHLYVLEDRPAHRIAHLHAIDHGGPQWLAYLAVRDRLRTDSDARRRYADLKRQLARAYAADRTGYTAAKATAVTDLLTGNGGAAASLPASAATPPAGP